MVNPNRFYTYAYLRKDRTPYYIGKGTGYRATRRGKRDIKPPKDKSRIIKLKQNLTEEEAFKHEIYMIAVFGRIDLGTGILRNRTNGGENPPKNNVAGWNKGLKMNFTPERGKKISAALKGKPKSKEHNKKVSESMKGREPWNKKTRSYLTPDGETVTIRNLQEYCNKHNLVYANMTKLYRGGIKQHKGYTVAQNI
jgi:hypothetical protein